MAWRYEIFNEKAKGGLLTHNGAFQTVAYSGHGEGTNNVAMQDVPNVGPIPVGKYKITPARFSEKTGPLTMRLIPEGHDAFGRTDFEMHGDNEKHDASHGCIIAGPATRNYVNSCVQQGDNELEVVP